MKRILNVGSLNIDHVYRVQHISRAGETLASNSYALFAGGKGANQSAALAQAGAQVFHAGRIGPEGEWLVDKLLSLGCDMRFIERGPTPTGHALIQVDDMGQNSIVLYPGSNHEFTALQIDTILSGFNKSDILLLQNEINNIPYLIKQAKKQGMEICFNPAPFAAGLKDYPLEMVDILVFNQTEGQGLSGQSDPAAIIETLAQRYPNAALILTLGDEGLYFRQKEKEHFIAAQKVKTVDTTAAGDTFVGFFLAAWARGASPETALEYGSRAAALSVTRAGALDSIPHRHDLEI
jgi:ribokinase